MELAKGYKAITLDSITPTKDGDYGAINQLMKDERYQQAYRLVEDLIGKNKQDPAFLIAASQVYKSVHQADKEKQCLENLVKISPKALHKYLLAECLSSAEDYPGALKLLHEVMDSVPAQDPVAFDALKSMGNIYLKCGDIEASEEKYNQANRLNPKDQGLIVNYGVLAIQKGEYDRAKEKFTEAIYIDAKHDVAWVGMALVHRAHSDFDLARACLLRALDENPTNKIAIIQYYQWCLDDDVESNMNHLDHYLNIYPSDAEVQQLHSRLNA